MNIKKQKNSYSFIHPSRHIYLFVQDKKSLLITKTLGKNYLYIATTNVIFDNSLIAYHENITLMVLF